MSKNPAPIIHSQKLLPSDQDILELAVAVENNFLKVSELHLRVKHVPFLIPEDISSEIMLWRGMLDRWMKGDYRNTRSEQLATRVVAQWTLDLNLELRNQAPIKLKWKD